MLKFKAIVSVGVSQQMGEILLSRGFYPHMPTGKVWIYWLLFVCVCLYDYGFIH